MPYVKDTEVTEHDVYRVGWTADEIKMHSQEEEEEEQNVPGELWTHVFHPDPDAQPVPFTEIENEQTSDQPAQQTQVGLLSSD